jgi:hypothetical protein
MLAIVVGLMCAAPTPGDVGGCGQRAQELDPEIFFASKANIDCERCRSCSLTSDICKDACAEAQFYPNAFPKDCVPLVHDGEVCLRALLNASCDDYATYVRTSQPRVPSECDFCPQDGP